MPLVRAAIIRERGLAFRAKRQATLPYDRRAVSVEKKIPLFLPVAAL